MNLKDIGWDVYASGDFPDSSVGRIACAARDRFVVWTESAELEATVSGQLRHHGRDWPCTGDWVALRDGNVIARVLPRRTKLCRHEPGTASREQVLAANIDVLFIVSGLDHDYNPHRLERYVVLGYESGARPIILLNKADLQSDVQHVIRITKKRAPGVLVFAVSARTGDGLEVISAHVRAGETAALIGSSGTGKSTIVNCLLGHARQSTTEVRSADSRGRHTTTRRELIQMPGNWLLMDLPGLREVQLWAEPEEVERTFSDIAELASRCKFRDCTHRAEPGCAVRDAPLDPDRLRSYDKLKREAAFLERRADPHLARQLRQKWNAAEKAARKHPKRMF